MLVVSAPFIPFPRTRLASSWREYLNAVGEGRRQSSEDSRVTVARATGSMTCPAEFILVAALNP